ncbi:hypothetical protein [Agromyces allii]|uniref:Uncharacterized protein n=1 Tax=Agromyces allii TaxID=393607 RepID=A0ABN2QIC2_9MICO|nr:hypothetical protein [Agromyces allii]
MTSSQEPQLTRREMRERERLQEQVAASPTPIPAQQAPQQPPAPAAPAAPIQSPAPQPVPAYGGPTQAAGAAQPAPGAPYGSTQQPAPVFPTAAPLPAPVSSAFAPTPAVAPVPPVQAAPVQATPVQPAPTQAPMPSSEAAAPAPRQSSTPERTLTRRELRALLDGDAGTDGEEFDDLDHEIAGASAMDAPRPPAAIPPSAAQSAPPASSPHQPQPTALNEQPVVAPKPVGHWTAQLDAPVESAQPYDQMLSRGGVGRGVPTTTNALILPSLPDHAGIPAPITNNGNGEVIVTGSIDLPRSYGATGVHPSQIDSSDVDHLFDQVEDGAGIGAPVAATRAISTQSASKAVVAPPSKEGMNVPLVLAVTAGVLALGVVGTLVIGALTGLF